MLIIEEHFRSGVLLYLWAKYFWKQMLETRQRNVLRTYRMVPIEMKNIISDEKYKNDHVLALYRCGFTFFRDTISIGIATALVVFNGIRRLWDISIDITTYLNLNDSCNVLQSALFITVMNSCSFLVNLPFAAYELYVMENHEGVHRVSISGALLGHIITQAILFPFVCLFVFLVQLGGDKVFLYVFFFVELQALLEMADTNDIFISLPSCDLRNKLEAFLAEQDFPLYDICVTRDPTDKLHHSQTYICGAPGQKVVVLYSRIANPHYSIQENEQETLPLSVEEIIALVAHETGHWKYCHSYVYFILNQIYLCVHLILMHQIMKYQPLYRAFDFQDEPYAVGFVLIQFCPIFDLCHFLLRIANRRLEISADKYVKGLKRDQALKSAIVKIGKHSIRFPVQDWLYSFCYNAEQSCYERIVALNRY